MFVRLAGSPEAYQLVQASREGDNELSKHQTGRGGGIGALLFMVYIPVHVVKE